jgi:YidC/Oxa1 family membrane protein insertase
MAEQQLRELGTTRPHVIAVAVPLMIVASIATHFTARHSVERQSAAAAANPQAAIMNKLTLWIFPLGVLVGGFFFPIAILIYWLANNAWTLGQQWLVYRKIDREETEKKEAAVVQRQSLAPRPGQKPVQRPAQKSDQESVQTSDQTSDRKPAEQSRRATDPQPTEPDAGSADSVAGDGNRATGGPDASGVSDVQDVPGVAAAGQPPAKQSQNGSRPQQRKQPQRVPQKRNRKRR